MVSHIKLAVIDEPELLQVGEFAPREGWEQAVSTVASTFCANGVRTVIISAQYSGPEPTCHSDLGVIEVVPAADKLSSFQHWCAREGISYKEVACLSGDEKMLSESRFGLIYSYQSVEPNILKQKVVRQIPLQTCCLDEFVTLVLESRRRSLGTMDCVIPCANLKEHGPENMNTRKFGRSDLLTEKLRIVHTFGFDTVLLTTNDQQILKQYERDANVVTFSRTDELCKMGLTYDDLYMSYARLTSADSMFVTTPASPFLSVRSLRSLRSCWETNPDCDVVMFSFTWYNVHTGDKFDIPLQQAGFIINPKVILARGGFSKLGKCAYVQLDEMERTLVRTEFDFALAESLLYRNLNSVESIEHYMLDSGFSETKVLDCTIRDTGYLNNWSWSLDAVLNFARYAGEIGIEYFEIGFFKDERFIENGAGVWRNLIEHIEIVHMIQQNTKSKISVMVDSNSKMEEYIAIERIPPKSETRIDLIRVFCSAYLFKYGKLDSGLEYCKQLKAKGYTVSLNIGHCAHLESEEVVQIKLKVKEHRYSLDYLCFADSLGMLTPNELGAFITGLKELHPVQIGFHNHDNHGTVFSNVVSLLNHKVNIIDATVGGFGKNGGNANLEQIIMYLHFRENYDFNIDQLLRMLDFCKDIDFGPGISFSLKNVKVMLQQFMSVHSSHVNFSEDILTVYDKLCKVENKRKLMT